MLDTALNLRGCTLVARDGPLGSVEQFFFDDQHWKVRYLVADTPGWLSGRQVLISPLALGGVDRGARAIVVNLTKKQVAESPPLARYAPVSRQFEESYYQYFGWPTYWSGPHVWGQHSITAPMRIATDVNPRGATARDPHLRSTDDIRDHHVHALDGEIGHVKDVIVDDETWAVPYFVVDTQNWWPGRKVVVSPRWVERVSWADKAVDVRLTRHAVRSSPKYSDTSLFADDYEARLREHYDRQGFGLDEPARVRTSTSTGPASRAQEQQSW